MQAASYPAPDRSNFQPNKHRSDPALPEGDLGAYTGAFGDGRPYRVESWYTSGLTLVTSFFSVLDLESAAPEDLLAYVMPILVETKVPKRNRILPASSVKTIEDASGNRMFSLTFIVAEPR